jgi:hypothetical protein
MLHAEFAPCVLETDDSFAAMLERVAQINPYLVHHGLAAGGVSAAALIEDRQLLDGLLQQILARYGATDQPMAAAIFLNSYAWYVGAAAIGCYLVEGRVPSLAPENVDLWIDFLGDEKRIDVALHPAESSPWPADSASSPAELRTRLRLELEAHLEPLIERLHCQTRLGKRAQWYLVADACASVFVWFGQRMGTTEASCAEGLALIGAPESPLRFSKTGYFTLEHAGICQTFRKRGGCCLSHKAPAGNYCSTCPLISVEERDRRLTAWMASQQQL